MALAIRSYGAQFIFVNTGVSNAPELLGTCVDKPQHITDIKKHAVYGDEGGGAEGEPLDIQLLGQIYIVRFTLINIDTAVWAKVANVAKGKTLGDAIQPGIFGSSVNFKVSFANFLKDETLVGVRRYLKGWPLGQIDWEAGTIAQQLPMAWEFHRDPTTQTYFDDDDTGIALP